ncbi:ABC transporter ATP-binding protein [Allokutzneria multivorans]|uniref:ABC transporter ATP-binding protein n=2 Tax=Allokutzneria multivorans TaxID=1142134 RepID=A0ABP7R1J0_9PSEU
MTMLGFTGVGKRFADGTTALADIDLDVAPGEFVSVVGPSGCGKTSLLRIAAGLSDASEGAVRRETERVGYVFQDATLLPWRTVQSNVELLAELKDLPEQERRGRADEAIELVGLKDFAGHRPGQLSGGMRMRVSLARSLTVEPELFLFDEPFGALDEITRQRLGDELLRLFTLRGFAGLMVTHSVTEALYLSTRVLVLSDRPGRVIGDFAVPFAHPRSPELRFEDEFTHLAGKISACLRGGAG